MEHFILMSDVKSSGNKDLKLLENDLKNVIGVMNRVHKKNLITPLDMVMADEFQGITNSLSQTLQLIFDIEECIIENSLDLKLKHVLYHYTI